MLKNKFRKLVVFDNIILTRNQREKLIDCAEKVEFYPRIISQEEIKEKIKDADALINCWTVITEDALIGSKIKYIGNWGHWWKHRIILTEDKLKEMGIHLDYIPDYGTESVAELTWVGILALSKNLEKWHKDAGIGKWTYENIKKGEKSIDIEKIDEQLIKGKTLGIVGLGKIGSRVAEIGLKAFNMNVIYYSRTRKNEYENLGIKFVPLEKLFQESDIISIHVSLDAPVNMIDKRILNLMKPGTILVNTSTGKVIDQKALIEILKTKKIKAFLDVYDQFPPRKELKDLPNVIFTYRLGWFTKESLEKKGEKLVSNIEKFLSNK